jgi:hypothetical protein
MQLRPLYRVRFVYPEGWTVNLTGERGTQGYHYYFAEGRCEGRISGRFRGANHPRSRTDGTFMPDFQGVIETDDGATILFDHMGYGRAYPAGRRQIVMAGTHVTEDERYKWLNDVVCAGTGEVRTLQGERENLTRVELVLDVAELVWEPIAE